MTFRPLPPAFTLWNLWNHNLKDAAKRSHACFFCLWHQQQRYTTAQENCLTRALLEYNRSITFGYYQAQRGPETAIILRSGLGWRAHTDSRHRTS